MKTAPRFLLSSAVPLTKSLHGHGDEGVSLVHQSVCEPDEIVFIGCAVVLDRSRCGYLN